MRGEKCYDLFVSVHHGFRILLSKVKVFDRYVAYIVMIFEMVSIWFEIIRECLEQLVNSYELDQSGFISIKKVLLNEWLFSFYHFKTERVIYASKEKTILFND